MCFSQVDSVRATVSIDWGEYVFLGIHSSVPGDGIHPAIRPQEFILYEQMIARTRVSLASRARFHSEEPGESRSSTSAARTISFSLHYIR